MAKIPSDATELYRFFDPKRHVLKSIRSDGTTLICHRDGHWIVFARKRQEVDFETWRNTKQRIYDNLPAWCKKVKSLPSMKKLGEWAGDSVCKTTDGEVCEPDFPGSEDHGPSWLIALGLI